MLDLFDDILPRGIYEFEGEYHFLSNFYLAPFVWQGAVWPSTEHAYQAAKSLDPEIRERIRKLPTPGRSKRAGKMVELRSDWEEVKVWIMLEIVYEKFKQNPELKARLIATDTRHLEEGNTWRDKFWGVCPPRSGNGLNYLGKVLMSVREVLKDDI